MRFCFRSPTAALPRRTPSSLCLAFGLFRQNLSRFVAAVILIGGSTAFGSFKNENSLVVGDLSAGMGGAAVAVVGDSAGAPYYNPATLAFLDGQAFSAAVGIYKKFDMLYGKEEDLTQAPLRMNQGFFRSLPASTGSVIRWEKLPDWTMAFSVVVPDYEQFKGDLRNDGQNISTLNYTDESLWVGGSLSRRISPSESMGLTVYYTARNFTRTANDRTQVSANHSILYTNEKTLTENALVPTLGYYKLINDKWSWGVSARLPAFKIQARATIYESLIDADGGLGTVTQTSTNIPERAARVFIPAKLTMGVSWRPDPTLLLAADVSLREGKSYGEVVDYDKSIYLRHQAIWNAAFGVEKQFVEWLRGRMGLYTNFSSQPNPEEGKGMIYEDRVDMLGFSANFVFIAGQKISYTFGGYYVGGRGRSLQRINQLETVVPKTTHVFTMLVGTSFSF